MKTCNACHVHVRTGDSICPLCGEELHIDCGKEPQELPQNPYPDLSERLERYHFASRLLVFFTLLGVGVSVLVNWLATPDFWWSLIVLACAAYCWITLPPLLRRGANYAARVVWQVIFTSILMVVLDLIVGYTGWSVSYVIPSVLAAGILAIAIMEVFNRTNWTQYVFCQVIIGVFGFLPLLLYLLGLARNLVMVLVTSGMGLASILAALVFADRSIKNEFRRRFHL